MGYWNSLTIKTKLIICNLVLLVTMLIIGVLGINNMGIIKEDLDVVFNKRIPSINFLLQADRDLQQMLVAERTLLYSDLSKKEKENLLKDFNDNREQARKRFEKYRAFAESESEEKIIEDYSKARKEWVMINSQVIELMSSDTKKAIDLSTNESQIAFEKMRTQMDLAQELILKYAKSEKENADAVFKASQYILSVVFIIGTLLGILFSAITIISLVKSLKAINDKLVTSASDLNDVSDKLNGTSIQLSSSTTQQSASLNETVSSLQEISSMVEKNTEHANSSLELTKQAKTNATSGKRNVLEMVQSINQIKDSNEKLIERVKKSNQEISSVINIIKEIGSKAEVINDIVFQTKLLSFNASVEAARAGEMGKGFAVVAEEVGNLAELSGKSADEISSLLERSISTVENIVTDSTSGIDSMLVESSEKVEKGIVLSKECESNLSEITSNVERVSESAREIATASSEQSAGVGEISNAMNEFESTSHTNNNLVNETTVMSTKVKKEVDSINVVVKELSSIL